MRERVVTVDVLRLQALGAEHGAAEADVGRLPTRGAPASTHTPNSHATREGRRLVPGTTMVTPSSAAAAAPDSITNSHVTQHRMCTAAPIQESEAAAV